MILEPQRVQVEIDVLDGVLRPQGRDGLRQLRLVQRRCGIVGDEAVLMGDAEGVEERAHHRALVRQVEGHQQAARDAIGHRGQAGRVLRPLLGRQRQDGLDAEVEPPRQQPDDFRVLCAGLAFSPEGLGGLPSLAFGHELPELRGAGDLFEVGHKSLQPAAYGLPAGVKSRLSRAGCRL